MILGLSFLAFACGSTQGASNTNNSDNSNVTASGGNKKSKINQEDYKEDSLLVRIELGACFGRCPVEKFSIYSSGNFSYTGINNVDKMGDFTGSIKSSDLDEIFAMMGNLKIDEYPEKFGYAVSDLSTKAMIFNYKGKRKKIIFKQYGDYSELKDFVTRVRGIMANGKYKRKVKE